MFEYLLVCYQHMNGEYSNSIGVKQYGHFILNFHYSISYVYKILCHFLASCFLWTSRNAVKNIKYFFIASLLKRKQIFGHTWHLHYLKSVYLKMQVHAVYITVYLSKFLSCILQKFDQFILYQIIKPRSSCLLKIMLYIR